MSDGSFGAISGSFCASKDHWEMAAHADLALLLASLEKKFSAPKDAFVEYARHPWDRLPPHIKMALAADYAVAHLRKKTMQVLEPKTCPGCGQNDRIESVEEMPVHYGLRVEENGTFDYDDEGREFDELSLNTAPTGFMDLYCRNCDEEWRAEIKQVEVWSDA